MAFRDKTFNHLVMCSQITYQLRNLNIKFHIKNCKEETCILNVLISHEPNFTCRILENTISFVFWVCLFLWMKLELPSLCNQSVPHSPGWPSGLLVVHSHLSFLFQSISKLFVNGKGPWFSFFLFLFQFCDVTKWLKFGKEKNTRRESIIPFSIYFKILSKGWGTNMQRSLTRWPLGLML